VELRDLAARVHLFDADGDDLGFAHAPAPVELGDVLVLADGSLCRVVTLVTVEETAALDDQAGSFIQLSTVARSILSSKISTENASLL
jgi:hypothetical protein